MLASPQAETIPPASRKGAGPRELPRLSDEDHPPQFPRAVFIRIAHNRRDKPSHLQPQRGGPWQIGAMPSFYYISFNAPCDQPLDACFLDFLGGRGCLQPGWRSHKRFCDLRPRSWRDRPPDSGTATTLGPGLARTSCGCATPVASNRGHPKIKNNRSDLVHETSGNVWTRARATPRVALERPVGAKNCILCAQFDGKPL
jgi:hypothetical protein